MTPPRIGIIGCGRIAQAVHVPMLQSIASAKLVAIAEADPVNRAAAGRLAPGCRLFEDFQELIKSGGVDAVVICLPPHLHASCAIAAFKAKLHVYVEKPLAPSVHEAAAVVSAWQAAGTTGMMGFNFRFHPQVQAVRAQLRRHAIGNLLAVRGSFTILPHEIPDWKQHRSSGGGVLLDLASHHIDLVHYLLNEPVTQAFATTRSLVAEGDNATVQLTMASGVSAQLLVSLGSVDENRIELFGSEGKLVVDRAELIAPQHVHATLQGARATRVRRAIQALHPRRLLRSPGFEPSFALALRTFAKAASGGPFSGPDLNDGVANLAVIEAAERAAVSGIAQTVLTASAGLPLS